jgi:hypothetical protein
MGHPISGPSLYGDHIVAVRIELRDRVITTRVKRMAAKDSSDS